MADEKNEQVSMLTYEDDPNPIVIRHRTDSNGCVIMTHADMQRIAEQIIPDHLMPSDAIAQEIRDKDIRLDVFKE